MANQIYWSLSWVSNEGSDLAPGQAHYWWANSFAFGSAVAITAHAVAGDHRILAVQDVRIDATPDGVRTALFTVRNVGSSYIPGYIVGFSVVTA